MVERYYPKLTLDFQVNKKICEEVAVIPSKRLRNKIAGYVTHLMKRIARGPVRGISLVLQEEERERRDNYVPDETVLNQMVRKTDIDETTKEMLEAMCDFSKLTQAGITVSAPGAAPFNRDNRFPRRDHRK